METDSLMGCLPELQSGYARTSEAGEKALLPMRAGISAAAQAPRRRAGGE